LGFAVFATTVGFGEGVDFATAPGFGDDADFDAIAGFGDRSDFASDTGFVEGAIASKGARVCGGGGTTSSRFSCTADSASATGATGGGRYVSTPLICLE
jgi:hypothetical protein